MAFSSSLMPYNMLSEMRIIGLDAFHLKTIRSFFSLVSNKKRKIYTAAARRENKISIIHIIVLIHEFIIDPKSDY